MLIALCRPFREGSEFASPASNKQVADEVFLSVDAVKANLRALFESFEVGDLPQNQKRVRLAELALRSGVITPGIWRPDPGLGEDESGYGLIRVTVDESKSAVQTAPSPTAMSAGLSPTRIGAPAGARASGSMRVTVSSAPLAIQT